MIEAILHFVQERIRTTSWYNTQQRNLKLHKRWCWRFQNRGETITGLHEHPLHHPPYVIMVHVQKATVGGEFVITPSGSITLRHISEEGQIELYEHLFRDIWEQKKDAAITVFTTYKRPHARRPVGQGEAITELEKKLKVVKDEAGKIWTHFYGSGSDVDRTKRRNAALEPITVKRTKLEEEIAELRAKEIEYSDSLSIWVETVGI